MLAGALLVGSALVWPELPDRVPGHFGFGGEVTRWALPAAFRAIVLVLTAATTPVVLGVWLPRIQGEVDRQVERERQLRRSDADDVSDPQIDAP